MEVLVILLVTVVALWMLEPLWIQAVIGGDVAPWPLPDKAWYAGAVPVLGVLVAVLARRTGQATAPGPGSAPTGTAGPSASVAAASWARPAGGGPSPAPVPARPPAAGPVEVPSSWLPAATAAPPPPAPIMVPSVEAVERTQVRAHPPAIAAVAAGGAGWLARLDDGTEIPVDEPVVIGRNPALAAGESAARLVPVADPSISKTHLRLDPGTDLVTVVDRHSTNGVEILDGNGTVIDCAPGAPTAVPDGGTIRFGDRALVLHRRG